MGKDIKILLVDDDPAMQDQISYFFKKLSYTLMGVASSGKEGIQQALKTKPDLILMDVMMETPQAGIDAARVIRSKTDIPVVFLTASKKEKTLIKALKTNPFGYLVKPIKLELLHTTIEITLLRNHYEKELKQYQQALEESEKLFKGIFTEMKNGYYRIDEKGEILLINRAMMSLLEYKSEKEMIGKKFTELGCVEKEVRDVFFKNLKQKGEISTFESKWKTSTNKAINIIENAHAINDDKGQLLYYEGTIQDITHMKELEFKLRHSKQMEVIGTLGSRISHEINSRLTVILGYADLCVLNLEPEEKLYKYSKAIQKNARITADVVRQLLNISRKPGNKFLEFDLNQRIKIWEEVFKQMLGENVVLKLKLHPQHTTVYADQQQIEHAILNLLINARDSMPDGGNLTIKTLPQVVDNDFKWNLDLPHGSYSSIIISDTGAGIQDDMINNIFDPFFTTKDPSVGTGLGLSIVKNIIQENHGFITVSSKVDKGTEFHILLPATSDMSNKIP